MSIDDVVNVTVSAQTQVPTRLGFGNPMFLAVHNFWPERTLRVTQLQDLIDAEVPTYHPVYRGVAKAFSQNPRPEAVIVGKRTRLPTQIVHLTPTETTEGYVYSYTYTDPDGVATEITHTVGAGATVATIVDALVILQNACDGATATDGTTHMVITADAAGEMFNLSKLPNPSKLKVSVETANPGSGGIAGDVADCYTDDPDSWYGLGTDANGQAELEALAAWTEANGKLSLVNTSDTGTVEPGTTDDVMSTLEAASYARTGVLGSYTELLSFSAMAWLGAKLPTTPGASTWYAQILKGVTVDVLTGAQTASILGKSGNCYTSIAGLGFTRNGWSASGEYLDITHFCDWLKRRIQERILMAISQASNAGRKIPYTDGGVELIKSLVYAQLKEGIDNGGLSSDPLPTVTAPKVADIDPANRANRLLPDVRFQGTLAGAIHKLQITGVLSV